MKQRIAIGLLAGSLLAAAPAAADVIVRAEGANGTVITQVSVPASGPDVVKSGATCPGGSAGGALDRAVDGDWDGTAFSFGLSVDRIRSENLPFSSGKYWAFDVNNSSAPVGVCDYKPQDGDEILFYAACADATTGCSTGMPLDVVAPERVTAGKAFTVTVREYDDFASPPTSALAQGATVAGGSKDVTTGSAGTARVTLDGDDGKVTLVATKGTQVRDSVVYRCRDGVCARTAPEPYALPDAKAPATTIAAPKGRFAAGKGPRKLRVSVKDASGVDSVRFALTRDDAKSCSTYNAKSERFVAAKCGARRFFKVDAGNRVSFLLPGRLPEGKYTFVALATDAAGNAERVSRGRNRVVFRVR